MDTRSRLDHREPSAALATIETAGWAILGLLAVAAFLVAPLAHAAGLLLGGVCALGSLHGMDIYFARIFQRNGARPKWWLHLLYGIRFLALMAAVAAAVGLAHLPVVGLLVGLSVPVMAICYYGVRAALKGQVPRT